MSTEWAVGPGGSGCGMAQMRKISRQIEFLLCQPKRERLFFLCCFCCHKKQWIHLIFRKLDYFSCCSRNYLSAPNEVLRKSHFRHVSCKFPMKQRAHMQMVFRQLGLCLIYTRELLFKYFMEVCSYIYCIIITCKYLIILIVITEHLKLT